ncbi:hypothetical protein PO587_02665 [Streptomyces gilvifuscus]|uniref:Uncharacterized protein n=1 Tax=Streptomyces gilvifuscus TaxID=1550617 RepID=A0ABT5FLE9_9ACTN|nr:hypothetical protein [Streptomyces gilvifuscus]MDC2953353.1 hypothetical protein [Streptomyces gilvifuscus]
MKGLVILDPEAPGGRRRVRYGPVVNGRTIASPAMKKLVEGLVRDAEKVRREEELMDEWVQSQLATAPSLTVLQTQMLRRAKGELVRAAQVE